MRIISTRDELAIVRREIPGPVGVVMTMGALHAGHISLIREAKKRSQSIIVTIFVNPIQFGPHEDFARYPRTFDGDVDICEAEGVDVVFAPSVEQIYPQGKPHVMVVPGLRGEILEGASRPGFFHGVLTVVLKLINLTRPDIVYFGEKDYQQLVMVRTMVADFDVPVDVVGVPIARQTDGLALSSRNRYLSESDKKRALVLFDALSAGAAVGRLGPAAVVDAARAVLGREPKIQVDYLELVDVSFERIDFRGTEPHTCSGTARLLVAARIAGTRLIDNMAVELG